MDIQHTRTYWVNEEDQRFIQGISPRYGSRSTSPYQRWDSPPENDHITRWGLDLRHPCSNFVQNLNLWKLLCLDLEALCQHRLSLQPPYGILASNIQIVILKLILCVRPQFVFSAQALAWRRRTSPPHLASVSGLTERVTSRVWEKRTEEWHWSIARKQLLEQKIGFKILREPRFKRLK